MADDLDPAAVERAARVMQESDWRTSLHGKSFDDLPARDRDWWLGLAGALAAAGLLVTPEHDEAVRKAVPDGMVAPRLAEHDAQVAQRALLEEADAADRQAQRTGDTDLAITAVYLRARARVRADRIERQEEGR